ncbi:hypothetical protein M1329_01460 [Candidatus Marsarchaeota archaeon]|nr:hypothetical protein [Candidatus Marsarchaeota archaeon]MCL5100223.1 hypothetical protein [Candidatus Marsarchaeota archaeon]
MQEVYIPSERARLLARKGGAIKRLERLCGCEIKVKAGMAIELAGEAYGEYVARSVVYAFGRGFSIEMAERLVGDEVYFSSIDFGSVGKNRVGDIRARLIGANGRAKSYIERVSGAHISVYGDTISFIGKANEIDEAETAARTLIEGGSHRLAYARMEAAHRKNKRLAEMV